MSKLAKALTAAAGNAGESLYVEDVFSTYVYNGNGTTNTIVNGIDISGEGGLLWTKSRSTATGHQLHDTERGRSVAIRSNTTDGNGSVSASDKDLVSFNSDGFTLGAESHYQMNNATRTYASWTFRKAEKFFDVLTYTGNGTTQAISHNLGSTPACIIVKNTQSSTYWAVYHESIPAYVGFLNATNGFNTSNTQNFGNNTNPVAPTDSVFTVGQQSLVNSDGETYVAYLFASDAGGFGDNGSESIIKCGSFDANLGEVVDLGFEPQFIIYKSTADGAAWRMADTMRGWTANDTNTIKQLFPNLSNAESDNTFARPTPTGFIINFSGGGQQHIYIAIRRPMKTPESGTEVFNLGFRGTTEANSNNVYVYSGFPVDFSIQLERVGSNSAVTDRLRGSYFLVTQNTGAEFSVLNPFDTNLGWLQGTSTSDTSLINYMFKRATGFFDVVAYTGTGANTTFTHNLGVAPELMVVKNRSSAGYGWLTYSSTLGATKFLQINSTAAEGTVSTYWNNTAPTSSVFSVGTAGATNASGNTYIAYLFASVAGVSKVGSYTGTGADLNIDCGFSAGARFILIKRTDSSGDWYVWDSVRGIVAGNDPYLLINSTAAEVTSTDYIDPLASGFTVTSSAPAALNASGGTYIFLAIA